MEGKNKLLKGKSMTLDQFLSGIEERLAAATPGPWRRGNAACVWDDGYKNILVECNDAHDADLVTHAPTDLATLVAVVRRYDDALTYIGDTTAEGTTRRYADNARAEIAALLEKGSGK